MVKKIEKVKDELLDHDFDGIQELDNELPPWWLMLFYITIIWSVVYLLYYHVLGIGPSSAEEYQQEMARAEQLYGKQQQGGGATAAVMDEDLKPLTDQAALAAGKAIYTKNCVACHGPNGEGGIGPNLTDEYWIHGGSFKDIVHTITVGVPQKGMVPWGPVLKKDEIIQVASYVWSLYGTNPPNAKAPEGEKYDRAAAEAAAGQ